MLAAQSLGAVPGAAVPGRGGRRVRVPDQQRRGAARHRRGPGAGRQDARDRAAVPARRASGTTTRAACALRRTRLARWTRWSNAARARHATRLLRRRGGHRQPPGTWRRCSSPPAPPATRRAWCQTHFIAARPRRPAEVRPLTESEEVWPTCRRPGSANIFSYAQWLAWRLRGQLPRERGHGDDRPAEIGPTYYFAPPRMFEACSPA